MGPSIRLGVAAGIATVVALSPLAALAQYAPGTQGASTPIPSIDRRVLDLELSTQRAIQRRALEQQRHRLDRAEDRFMNAQRSSKQHVPVVRPSCRSGGSRLTRMC
ncbi:MAG: hypothetical protein K5872_17840 [Rhizobiaceae bacterium]|nr:hypothetical protein [Rhizobiaceae bacterium]